MVNRYLATVGYVLVGGTAYKAAQGFLAGDKDVRTVELADQIPTRKYQLSSLKKSTSERPFDLLIVGGGATGSGIALDAATRGLRTALVERDDFGSGTSSKSTKLVHGGVRYLEKAFWNMDLGQLKLVTEALHERRTLLDNAPHLTAALPILMPCYRWWEVPYFWAGLKAYDLVAGSKNLVLSKFVSPAESIQRYPSLAQTSTDGHSLKGTVMYFDGQFDDARLNVALACTSAAAGATVLNHVEASSLIKTAEGKVVGAVCRDTLTGEETPVYARVVVNATGPYVDSVRRMSDAKAPPVITPSAGAHITLPSYYAPGDVGLIIPKTKDGRVCFVLPWQGFVVAGTTDTAMDSATDTPRATAEEVSFILDSISDFLSVKVRKEDVLSTWSGIRPLASDPSATNTSSISRDHVVITEPDGSITVTGGKWTTYRKMAEDAVDTALATGRLPAVHECCTSSQKLLGAQHYSASTFTQVAQDHNQRTHLGGIDTPTAWHLTRSYGDRAERVIALGEQLGLGRPLVQGHPVQEGEVVYCCRNEYCETVTDFVGRRTRLAFVDANAALAAVPRVAELMAAELGWSSARKKREVEAAQQYLDLFTP